MLQLIAFGIVGAIIGAVALEGPGAVIGFCLAWLLVSLLRLRKMVDILEGRLALIESRQPDVPAAQTDVGQKRPQEKTANRAAQMTPPPLPAEETALKAPAGATVQFVNRPVDEGPGPAAGGLQPAAGPEASGRKQSSGVTLAGRLRQIIGGGNPVVRIGVVVLFFGIGFLMKYAAGRGLLPIELRLAGSVLIGMAMLAVGWRVRHRRQNYGTVLQGGGIGIMYLTLFATARLFGLIRLETAFALMVLLVILAGVLAVCQKSRALAVFGSIGGFMAPILASTGEGSHVMLFTYYALLNAGILGVAWFKSWRVLNITGFVFTFSIGLIWGLQFYRPFYFVSTEPFLILFFVMYVAISVIFAFRQPWQMKGFVDNTLVFGLPVVAFGLQASLLRFSMSGLAASAFVLGAFYLVLAAALKWRTPAAMHLLAEAFMANGIVFASLAIPMALGSHWTAMAWALEGAALIWIGVRQQRCLPRMFGLLLQIGAGAAFVYGFNPIWFSDTAGTAVSWFEGGIIALAGLFSAYYLETRRAGFYRFEKQLFVPALLWGLLWWAAVGCRQIASRTPEPYVSAALLAFAALSVFGMGILSRRLNWHGIAYPTLLLLPIMALAALDSATVFAVSHPFASLGWAAWPAAFGVQYYLLRSLERRRPATINRALHLGTALLALTILTWEAGFAVYWLTYGARIWTWLTLGALPAVFALAMIGCTKIDRWPLGAFKSEYTRIGPSLLSIYLLIWSLYSTGLPGQFTGLPYLPVLNPLDAVQLLVLTAIGLTALRLSRASAWVKKRMPAGLPFAIPAAAAFVWLNAVAARTVHHWGQVPYTLDGLHHSVLFQTVISVLWGATALTAMVWANRSGIRRLWFAGAGLLGLEVFKLFLVDLSGTGTVARIVSFLAVGGLMLVIGFYAPLPPAGQKTPAGRKADDRPGSDNLLDTSVVSH